MYPKVSILIPAYRQPEMLARALASVFQQTFQDFEVIVTDDSPDDSVQAVVSSFSKDSRLKYFKNIERKGSPGNWNEAIRLASGEYIKFLHHDDWLYSEQSLSIFVNALDCNPQAMLAFGETIVWEQTGLNQRLHSPTKQQLKSLRQSPTVLIDGNIIGAPSATIYRNHSNLHFDIRLKWLVDIDFYIALMKICGEFVFCSQPLINTTAGADHQVTAECVGNKEVEVFEYCYLYRKYIDEMYGRPSTFKAFESLVTKYDLIEEREILECGVGGPVASELNSIMRIRKFIQRYGRIRGASRMLHPLSRCLHNLSSFQPPKAL